MTLETSSDWSFHIQIFITFRWGCNKSLLLEFQAEFGNHPIVLPLHIIKKEFFPLRETDNGLQLPLQLLFTFVDIFISIRPMVMWFSRITWQAKNVVSAIIVPMITKLGIMVINLEGLLPVKLLNTFFTWSCKIIRQTKANYQSAYDTKLMVTYLKHLLLNYAVSQDQATN